MKYRLTVAEGRGQSATWEVKTRRRQAVPWDPAFRNVMQLEVLVCITAVFRQLSVTESVVLPPDAEPRDDQYPRKISSEGVGQ